MSGEMPKFISVQIKRDASGWIVATSDDFPGLLVARPTLEEVASQIAEAVELLIQSRYHRTVTARVGWNIPLSPHSATQIPLQVPVEILAPARPI